MSENEQKCRDLRTKLEIIYGNNNITCSIGGAGLKCNKNGIHSALIAIHMNYITQTVVIWDLCRRRYFDADTDSVSITGREFENFKPPTDSVFDIYRKIHNAIISPYEKILITSISYLEKIIIDNFNLYDMLLFNQEDTNYPSELRTKKIDDDDKIWYVDKERTKSTIKSVNRYYKFRAEVLKRYDFKCAICRCDEEQILQAAHIIAVADNGSDNPKNGICLCANHHLMYDKKLIEIKNQKLIKVAESVKKMAWYQEFINKFNGEVLKASDS